MNLRTISAATVVLAALAVSASAAEVSKASLSSMGLGSMQILSDNDGLAIRGKGTSASAWGVSSANFMGQHASNGYTASASHHSGSSLAGGANLSTAGVVGTIHGNSFSTIGIAGGFSVGFAK